MRQMPHWVEEGLRDGTIEIDNRRVAILLAVVAALVIATMVWYHTGHWTVYGSGIHTDVVAVETVAETADHVNYDVVDYTDNGASISITLNDGTERFIVEISPDES